MNVEQLLDDVRSFRYHNKSLNIEDCQRLKNSVPLALDIIKKRYIEHQYRMTINERIGKKNYEHADIIHYMKRDIDELQYALDNIDDYIAQLNTIT